MNNLFKNALKMMIEVFNSLSKKAGVPLLQPMGKGYVFRYSEKSIYQAIVQKLTRIITGLQAITFLNQKGFLQEQASLQRVLDEFEEDIFFLCSGIIFNDITDLHQKYLDAFYEEEFDNPDSAIESTQKRPMISRKKIRAYNSKDRGIGQVQSSIIKNSRTINKTYSGYVHGASPQLMELYFGEPPCYNLTDGTKSPFFEDHKEDLLNYFYRGICSFVFAAKAFGDDVLAEKVYTFSSDFATASGNEKQFRP